MNKISRNIPLFKIYYLFWDMWPLSTLAVVYFEQITGSYASALGVFSLAKIVQTLAEIPTGIVSDRIGRKLTLVASSFLFTLCYIGFALAGSFAAPMPMLLMAGGVLWGIADAAASGTDEAFMYETMVQLGREEDYHEFYAGARKGAQFGLALAALIAAGVTWIWSLNALAWVSVVPIAINFFISFLLVEPEIVEKKSSKDSLSHFLKAFKELLKNRKLQLIALVQMNGNAVGFTAHRVEGAYFAMLVPEWAVNLSRFLKNCLGALSFHLAPKLKKFGFFKMLAGSSVGMTATSIVAFAMNNAVTPFANALVNLFYGMQMTSESALMQKEFSPHQRATMGSVISLAGGIIFAIVYYAFGMFADTFGIYQAVWAILLCRLAITAGYCGLLRKYGKIN